MMINILNRIGGVMGSVFVSSAVDRGLSPDRVTQRLYNWYVLLLR
jgi:hypothetical protein